MKAARVRVSLQMLVSAYRNAAHGGLRIGFRYSAAQIWDAEAQELKPITLRNDLRLFAGSEGAYDIDTESIDSGPISRRVFFRLLGRYAQSGFREMNISVRERSQHLKDLHACHAAKSNTEVEVQV